ncbi:MAG: 3-dehydroquinate synthase II [Candidatus Tritonobacter lacicola]|nr:3-dehydroquinate synthase II [Candidatus Tritonobacter lacicola]
MKSFWVDVRPWDKDMVTTALESGADAVIVPEGCSDKVRELGVILTVSGDGDIVLGKDVLEIEISGKADEMKAAAISRENKVIVKTSDWTIIPLENLVAQSGGIFAYVRSAEEARTALQVLEKGVAGVVVRTADPGEIRKAARFVKGKSTVLGLETAKVVEIKVLGMGDRVCVDTCTAMTTGEGMLVGNSSSAMFLVHSESVENPYVEARPFRVNAGALHAYVLTPSGKTKYLSELRSGDDVLVTRFSGESRAAIVGRAKVELRPMMLVRAVCRRKEISLILQNAETIRLVKSDGEPLSVAKLKVGDGVLCHISEGGRHFGMKVEETITER